MHDTLRKAYQALDLPTLEMGGIVIKDHLLEKAPLHLLLQSLNRHGLIAGATGSGKTKTIQSMSEQLCLQGVPTLLMDVKGDISGLAMPGESTEPLVARNESLNLRYTPRSFPVELLTLSGNPKEGVPLRATVVDYGPLLFSRLLGLNETQSGVVAVLFEYAKTQKVPLTDLTDMKALFQFFKTPEGKQALEASYGNVTGFRTLPRRYQKVECRLCRHIRYCGPLRK